MNKYEFIKELLANKKIKIEQREKIMDLVSREIGSNVDLVNRVQELEKTVFVSKKNIEVIKKYHDPKEMIKFLFSFSSNEDLKWFTHEPDLGFNKINYIERINDLFEFIKTKKLGKTNLNFSTISFVNDFFIKNSLDVYFPDSKNYLSYGNLKIKELLKRGGNPFEIKIDNIYFRDVINIFKCAIEIRLDFGEKNKFNFLLKEFLSNNLSLDIEEVYSKKFDVISASLTTYIDLNNFFRGLNVIVNWINSYKSYSNLIEIDLEETKDYYRLIIFHVNSKIEHEIDSEKVKGDSGDLKQLKNYWFSIVDFEILSDFKSNNSYKPYRLISLDKNTKMELIPCKIKLSDNSSNIKSVNKKKYDTFYSENIVKEANVDNIGGVKYIITIYKTKDL